MSVMQFTEERLPGIFILETWNTNTFTLEALTSFKIYKINLLFLTTKKQNTMGNLQILKYQFWNHIKIAWVGSPVKQFTFQKLKGKF